MATKSTLAAITVTAAQRAILDKKFGDLMNGLKEPGSKDAPPHISHFPKEKQEEVARKAAALIREDKVLTQAITKMIKGENEVHGLLFRNLPFGKVLKPDHYPLRYESNPGKAYDSSGNGTYYEKNRRCSFGDLFAIGVKQILIEDTGYQPSRIRYSELTNKMVNTSQPFHRDFWDKDTGKPRYTILCCNQGNMFTKTHIMNEQGAIRSLTDQQRDILTQKRFTLFGNADAVLQKHDGRHSLTYDFFDELPIMPQNFKANDNEAQKALDALTAAMQAREEAIALRHGDFFLLDQEYLLHRAGEQFPLLPRHNSRISFKGESDRSRWTVPGR